MIKLHATRLMRSGEVVLWREGAMVWTGAVGAHLRGIAFDTVSLHVDDSAVMGPVTGTSHCRRGARRASRLVGFEPLSKVHPVEDPAMKMTYAAVHAAWKDEFGTCL